MILGFIVGGIVSLVMKYKTYLSENTLLETMYVIVGAYFCYSVAHLPFFQLSGDVAIFFYGIMMSHYNKYNMSNDTFTNIGLTLNMLMLISEMTAFVYIGLSLEDTFLDNYQNFALAGILLGAMLLSRLICIGVYALLNRKNKSMKIYRGDWLANVSSFMIKGPLSFIFANIIVAKSVPCLDRKNTEVYNKVYAFR